MAASLERLGISFESHKIIVSVGGPEPQTNLYESLPWSLAYPIVWRWVTPEAWQRDGYRATNRDRAAYPASSDVVMLADSDVIFVDGISDLLERVRSRPAVYGVMAHVPPFLKIEGVDPRAWWARLFTAFDVEPPPHDHELSRGQSLSDCHRYSPAYFNGGMVIGPGDLMDALLGHFAAADKTVAELGTFRHVAQIARTLAMYKAGVPIRLLPMRYNFPNDEFFETTFPEELTELRILHYLRQGPVHKKRDFESAEAVATLIDRKDLVGANERLRQLLAELEPIVRSRESC